MQNNKIIKFLTSGNVDDGKSTLIGRLLYETNSIYADQLQELKKVSDGKEIDLSLLVDGLESEREQKITIDVAYRYFNYQENKYIIADAPGHAQYTRNMAVAASKSDSAIIVIDASKGIETQTIRHSYIISLFGIKNVIISVNKMDLVKNPQQRFTEIKTEFEKFSDKLNFKHYQFIPIIAINGDNIVKKSNKLLWYKGPSIIESLSEFALNQSSNAKSNDFQFTVQSSIKHNQQRFYQGNLESGSINKHQEILIQPGNIKSKITEIYHSAKLVANADAGNAVSIAIAEDIDISRGSIIASPTKQIIKNNKFIGKIIWFSEKSFSQLANSELIFKLNYKYIKGKIADIINSVNYNNLNLEEASDINPNDIVTVEISLSEQSYFSLFEDNNTNGSFIIIDPIDNNILAGGIISEQIIKKESQQNLPANFILDLNNLVKKHFANWQGQLIEQSQ
jgi:sulfate adenylyltransferase subunit 1